MAGKSINELPEITSVSDSSLMALSEDGKTLGKVSSSTLNTHIIGQYISNYIKSITKKVDVELNTSTRTITLKSGSKVYVPNGVGVFDEITIVNDVTCDTSITWTGNGVLHYIPDSGTIFISASFDCTTKSSWTPDDQYEVIYNTTENAVRFTDDTGTTWTTNMSIPFAYVRADGSNIVEILQVFDGFSYHGSSIFSFPGITYEIPNGRTDSGVLTNLECTTSSVYTVSNSTNESGDYYAYLTQTGIGFVKYFVESDKEPSNKVGYTLWFNTTKNKFYIRNFSEVGSVWEEISVLCGVCKYSAVNGKITIFECSEPLRLLDTNTFKTIPHIVETFDNGTSWYRLWSDGYIEQGGYASQPGATAEAYHTVTFLKPFRNNLYYIFLTSGVGQSGWQYANGASIGYAYQPDRNVFASTTSMQLSNAVGTGNVPLFWEVKGYVAE